ncbi:TPA: hypothetical protein QDC03_002522 [Burkholderia cepacia]|uniref:hypothetical protein n=1 Tax=Burkholderia TaxID=32008 RepID=UPI0011B1E194|nr:MULTISPECIES: hypothetical protein [Burkholderia]HDR9507439.1 hypothetical protein [Burkholderia cepacia]
MRATPAMAWRTRRPFGVFSVERARYAFGCAAFQVPAAWLRIGFDAHVQFARNVRDIRLRMTSCRDRRRHDSKRADFQTPAQFF